jgi:hypothetical protein
MRALRERGRTATETPWKRSATRKISDLGGPFLVTIGR